MVVRIAIFLILAGAAWPQGSEFAWETRLAPAVDRARKEGRPLLVYFRCPP